MRGFGSSFTSKQPEKPPQVVVKRKVNIDYEVYATKSTHLDMSSIVILHSLCGNKQEWKDISNELNLRTGRKVIACGVVNHGMSSRHQNMSYFDMALDLLILLEKLKINKATCVGHRMGGKTAMTLALAQPERIDQLVILDAVPIPNSSVIGYPNKLTSGEKEQIKSAKTRDELVNILKKLDLEDTFYESVCKNINQSEDEVKCNVDINFLLENYEEIHSFPSFMESVNYSKSCLFIMGENNKSLKSIDHELIYKRFPKADLKSIKNSTLHMHIEQPDLLLEVLSQYLLDVEDK